MERWLRSFVRLVGVVLLGVPFLPLELLFGEIRGLGGYVPPNEWLLGIAIFGAAAWVIALVLGDRVGRIAPRVLHRCTSVPVLGLALPVLAGVLALTSWFVFHHRPLLVDSVVQLFQARIFARGLLVAPAPIEPAFFATLHMMIGETGWVAQYPPGHAALLAMGAGLGAPWLVPVALTLGTLVLLRRFAALAYDRATANLTTVLLLLCPFFWFMGASFMNHVPTLFFLSLFLYALVRGEAGGGVLWPGLAGAAVGSAFLCRPLSALAFAAPLVAVIILRAGRTDEVDRTDGWRRAVVGTTAFAFVAGIYLAWNVHTTGHPFLFGYEALWGRAHGLGFHTSPWGETHTPFTGFRNELVDLALLESVLFEWPLPALLPLGVFLAAGWSEPGWDRRLLAAFLALPVAYFFYWHRDAYLGPRFLYAGVACVIPLTARALHVGWRRLEATVLPAPPGTRRVLARPFGAALIAVSVVYALFWGIPQRFMIYATGLSSMKVDLQSRARAVGIGPGGIIFVATSWGDRLLAQLHGLGVAPARAETAYRRADHCAIQLLIDRARSEGWPTRRIEAGLEDLVGSARMLIDPGYNDDPTLRLDPAVVLDPRCLDELHHDGAGYTVYAPHLLANEPTLDGEWIVARDLRERNHELVRGHPRRPAWRYRPGGFERIDPQGPSPEVTADRRSIP